MKRIFVLYVVLSICAAAFSQIKFPQIKWKSDSLIFIREKEALRYGVETFGDGLYVDSLIHYLDTICHVEPQVDNSVSDSIFQAVWNNDTLTYRVRSKIYRGYDYDSKSKKKLRNLVVESRIYPFARFSACIEKLDEAMIEVLKDSMLRMECPLPMLKNNYQTCIFYALDALFQTYGIYTEPVITRNTTYRREEELNAFFDYFLTSTASYPCRYKEIKNVTFPDNCILAFYNGYNHIIHAVFYRDGLFYTKNGLFSPMVLSTLHPVLKSYSRWDTSLKGLSKVGKQLKSDKIVVYTLNKNLFRVNK